jgi:hypothetical protein
MRIIGAWLMLAGGLAAAEEGRPLSMETVDRVIEKSDRVVQTCHRGAGRRGTLAVQMMLEIDAAGNVIVVEPVDKPSAESQCLARVARRLKFPSTGVTTKIAYPFMLLRR